MKFNKLCVASMVLFAGSLQGSLLTVNFDNTGSEDVGTVGNSISRSSGTFTVTASASSYFTTLMPSALGLYGSNGLGVCNSTELADGCTSSGDPSKHQIDNAVHDDFVVVRFANTGGTPQSVKNITVQIGTLASHWDVSFWLGNTSSTSFPNGLSYAGLTSAFGARTDISSAAIPSPYTVALGSNLSGNMLIFGTQVGKTNDGFKLRSISFDSNGSVPEPSTYALMGAGLLGLGYLRRKQA